MISSVNTTASTTRTYQYDPSGRLVAARGGGLSDEFFLYRDGTEPIAWTYGTRRQYYVYGSQRHVPDLIYEDTDGDVEIDNVYRVLTDERGSVRLVVSLAATPFIAQRIEYDVFGNPTFPVGGETVQPFGFAGAIWMPHARFWHMGARDYDPAVGRWTSKDPIRFAGGTNLYVYCEGDPVNYIDPTGRVIIVPILIGIAIVGATLAGAATVAQVAENDTAGLRIDTPNENMGYGPFMFVPNSWAPDFHRNRNSRQLCPDSAPLGDPAWTRQSAGAHDAYNFNGTGACTGFQCSYTVSHDLSHDPVLMGSYDYSPPGGLGTVGHLFADVAPVFIWGTGQNWGPDARFPRSEA